ncbi:MAG: class I SAM-dependent methyltransferase, partial [Anaerolineaceae bacterium]
MQTAVIQQLVDLNNTFYQTFGKAFAVTRRRIQPGITRCLADLPPAGDWLDLGCGGGTVADAWVKTPGRQGLYLGVDFSPVLLEEARQTVQCAADEHIRVDFCQADLASLEWRDCLTPGNPIGAPAQFDVISAFAVFHHIPGSSVREKICGAI